MITEAEIAADGLGRPCIVPVTRKWAGCEDPAEVYLSIRCSGEPSFLLESAERPGESARYSIVGMNPLVHVRLSGDKIEVTGKGEFAELAKRRASSGEDALDTIKKALMLDEIKVPAWAPRYSLGAFGYLCYEYALTKPEVCVKTPVLPEAEFMVPGTVILFDHVECTTIQVSAIPFFDSETPAVPDTKLGLVPLDFCLGGSNPTVSSNISKGDFEKMVDRAKDYIRRGDIIQAVLSRRIDISPAPPADVFYARLRKINPSPYMFFFDFPERTIVGSSPEMLVRVEGSQVMTRPIAGTRRLEGPDMNGRVVGELSGDEKERAEHVMLVDLGRNDLGKVCRFGTVKVRDFMSIEKYSHVVHMVSTVHGELRRDMRGIDALRAAFPAGTVTGAPKVRAMEIIDELERCRRGVYAGAVGCIGYTGDLDMAIAIRTMVVENGVGSIQVGAGIVADSVPWKEYYETENKARGLLEAAGCQ